MTSKQPSNLDSYEAVINICRCLDCGREVLTIEHPDFGSHRITHHKCSSRISIGTNHKVSIPPEYLKPIYIENKKG